MNSYNYFQNKKCKYFPCHEGADKKNFSCLFCYCPLYCLEENCGGNFIYTEKGVKDCSNCTFPHKKENYEIVIEKAELVIEKFKKNYE